MEHGFKRAARLGAIGIGAAILGRAALRRMNLYDFRGRAVLITGGSRGLGLVLAREFARHHARLAICARDPDELERAESELRHAGADVVTFACDITDRSQVEAMIPLLEEWGPVDVLVNNAGIIQTGPMEVMTFADYDDAMQIHFYGPLFMTEALLPQMRRRGGRIVNITSIGGRISVPHLLPYCVSKFAFVGYSQGLRAELAKDGVAVTTVCPGTMRTGSPLNAYFKGRHRAEYAWFSLSASLPLVSLSAERAARQIIQACRRGDAYITLSVPAKLADAFHGLFPGLTAELLGYWNRLLPTAGGIGRRRARGFESESAWSPSPLTILTQRAALRNNELPQ